MPQLGLFNLFRTLLFEPAFSGVALQFLLEGTKDPRRGTRDDESVGDFLARRMSSNLVDRVVSAVFHGIYAGDVWQLSAKSLLPTQWRDEVEQGSLVEGIVKSSIEGPEYTRREMAFVETIKTFGKPSDEWTHTFARTSVFTYRNGLQQLADSLTGHLRGLGNVDFQTNTSILKASNDEDSISLELKQQDKQSIVTLHSHVISALSPGHLSNIVMDPSLASTLKKIPAVTVMTVNLYYRTPGLHPPGFGYLIPLATPIDQNPERALGVVFDTSYAPDPNPELRGDDMQGPIQDTVSSRGTKLTVMLGGHYWNDWPVFPTEEEGLAMAKSLLSRHLGITEEPAAHMVNIQKDCIPQYTVGHEQRLKDVHAKLIDTYGGKFRVAGNWARGVGVNDCLRSAWDVARELTDGGKTGLEPVVEDKGYERMKIKKP